MVIHIDDLENLQQERDFIAKNHASNLGFHKLPLHLEDFDLAIKMKKKTIFLLLQRSWHSLPRNSRKMSPNFILVSHGQFWKPLLNYQGS